MSFRYYLEKHTIKEFIADKTRKCLVPSTIGLFVFQWIQGYFNMLLSGAFASMEKLTGVVLYLIMAVCTGWKYPCDCCVSFWNIWMQFSLWMEKTVLDCMYFIIYHYQQQHTE